MNKKISSLNTIPAKFRKIVETMPEQIAVTDCDFATYTYKELANMCDAIRSTFETVPHRCG